MNIKQLVEHLDFERIRKGVYRKAFESCELRVDFNSETLIYPEEQGFTVNERQTCNFNTPENFVVFECVYRLLSKGYRPQHLELEPKWKLGHGASGGRADILVKDNSSNAFLIIECKTFGDEFDHEWKDMLLGGGQLFSYYQQVKSTQYLCLYTADIIDDESVYISHIIAVKDNLEYLRSLKSPASFIDAADVRALFNVWRDTYKQEYETQGIFEDGIAAYEIGKAKHAAADLQEISHEDIQKKYHEFATILRQHNVSGRENAFDKLVNLFLAKIVDEMQNADELLFYWKGVAFDDYYNLQDRIQRLYRDGMQKFLGEEVTYIDNGQIEQAFRLFKNDPDATRDTILYYFRQLKFYTNNDFAFLDVHNEHLFFQNSVILLKIVRMLQDIKLKTEEQNQFLGDLFEGFLDQGIKQSEGQFFTPMPIVKFLVSSLPLEQIVKGSTDAPRVIDYACGAGHFLNEYAMQIRAWVPSAHLHEHYERVVGIEKEYRLSKVAKVSAFMYGQDEIEIVYADALANNAEIEDGIYSVLISNPPYSVKGFLEMLSEDERATFEISKVVGTKGIVTNNSIEVFFLERAKQLLAPGGVAAIILPSSILSNGGAIYTKAREIILQHFDIVAIAEFGSGTFGKTGTNTVTLFLRRKAENPALAVHYRNRVSAWYNGDFGKDGVFEDAHLLKAYCDYVNLDIDDYKTLMISAPNGNLLETDVFASYRTSFVGLSEIKNLRTKQFFKKLTAEQQQSELHRRFIDYTHGIEQEKLFYFMLAYSNPQPVVVVKSPTGTTEMKKFLGYEWSSAKGNEGIKYLGVVAVDENGEPIIGNKGINGINTSLFNPLDLTAAEKINTIIRNNFNGVSGGESEFISRFRLVDMLDFSGVKFEKAISLSAVAIVEIVSKFPAISLSERFVAINEDSINPLLHPNKEYIYVDITSVENKTGFIDYHNIILGKNAPSRARRIAKSGSTLISTVRPNLRAFAFIDNEMPNTIYSTGFAVIRSIDETILLNKYVYLCFMNSIIVMEQIKAFMPKGQYPSINESDIRNIKIPLPPLDIQREIITACEALDEEYNRTRKGIAEDVRNINRLFEDTPDTNSINLSNGKLFSVTIGKRVVETDLVDNGEVPVFSANVFEPFGFINERLITDFSVPSVLWGIDGDWMVNYLPEGVEFYPTDHCGILRVNSDTIHPRYLAWALEQEGRRRGFSRTLRASIDRVKRLTLRLPSAEAQTETVHRVFILESRIFAARRKLREMAAQEQVILESYLS